jgi:hypothetical protein
MMEKKNFWIAVGGGFIAGVGTALIVSTLCCAQAPKNTSMAEAMPQKIEMMKKAHHMKGHHARHFMGRHAMPTPEMREHFAKKLGLTDEQKAQLDKFRDEDMAKMKPLFEEMDTLHAKMEELRKVNRAHFESVLTDEQKEILKNMKKEWKHHRHHKHRHHFGKKALDGTGVDNAPVAEAPSLENAPAAVEEVVVTETIVKETPAENTAASETVPTVENAPVAE